MSVIKSLTMAAITQRITRLMKVSDPGYNENVEIVDSPTQKRSRGKFLKEVSPGLKKKGTKKVKK